MSDLPPPIQRPNGKWWRPRKPLRVRSWDNRDSGYNDDHGVLVLGTHDIELARPLAERWVSDLTGCCDYVANPRALWVRSAMKDGDPWWIEDSVRGAPAVEFAAAEEPEVDEKETGDG